MAEPTPTHSSRYPKNWWETIMMGFRKNMTQTMKPYTTAKELLQKVQHMRSSSTYLIVVVSLSFFTDLLAYGVIVPILPTALDTRAGIKPGQENFYISILLIVESASALLASPLAGHLVDASSSRQTYFLVASVILFLSILWTALSSSIALFIIGRCLQGAATAFVRVSGFAMVLDAVPADKIGQTLGWTGMANTAGFTVGPVLGGVLFRFGGWWSVFGMLLGLLFVDFCLRCTIIEGKRVVEDDESEYEVTVEAGAEGGVLQSSLKKTRKNGLMVLLRQPRMIFMLWGVIVTGILISAFDATLPVFVRDRFGWDALGQGLIFLPTALPALLDPVYGWMIDKFGVRKCAIFAFVLLAPVLLSLRAITNGHIVHKALLIILLTLVGFGFNVADISLLVETDDVVKHIKETQPKALSSKGAIAQSFGLQTMAMQLGVLLGPLTAGMINQYKGWNWMSAAMCILAAGTALTMLKVGKGWAIGRDEAGEERDAGQAVELQELMRVEEWNGEVVERVGASRIKSAFP